jgi:hypothetical protein
MQREHQLWAAACPQDEAVEQILNAVPEGWTAALLPNRLKPTEIEALNMKAGEVRELTLNRRDSMQQRLASAKPPKAEVSYPTATQ